MPRSSNDFFAGFQRDEAALYETMRNGSTGGAVREYASLHALLDLQFAQIAERLAVLAARRRNLGGGGNHAGQGHVLAARRQDGTFDVRESQIVAEMAELHLALSASLEQTATVLRHRSGDIETAGVLCELAEQHRNDAAMLRALLSEDHP